MNDRIKRDVLGYIRGWHRNGYPHRTNIILARLIAKRGTRIPEVQVVWDEITLVAKGVLDEQSERVS